MNPARVLVVDDNPETVALLTQTLELAGYAVRSAADPGSGMKLVNTEHFDIVLLDHRFDNNPSMVGISSVSEFSAMIPGGVVMITAFGNDDLEKDAKLLGASAYLVKPVTSEALLRTVAQLLSKPHRA